MSNGFNEAPDALSYSETFISLCFSFNSTNTSTNVLWYITIRLQWWIIFVSFGLLDLITCRISSKKCKLDL